MIYSFKSRLLTIVGLIIFCLIIVLGRVFQLQILQKDRLEDLAHSQHLRTVDLDPKRGKILDRKGRILALSVPVKSLYVHPLEIKSKISLARKLAPLVGIPFQKLRRILKTKKPFVWIKRRMDPYQVESVVNLNLEGIGFIDEFHRYYPERYSGAATIGFTGIDSQGLEGIEFEYQHLLKGESRRYVVEKEGSFRTVPLKGHPGRLPEQYSLKLTLDSRIQHLTEEHLAKGVNEARADRGTAIVMDSSTGAILAISIYPGFDPNRYERFSRVHYLNRAVTSGYEPGSTFKMITLSAALSEKLISPDQSFFCENGKFRVRNHTIHDVKKMGKLNLQQVLQKSSNICAAKIGMTLSAKRFDEYIRIFGFGKKPGTGLAAEASGKLLNPKRWSPVDHASISYGQGILVSPMQMLSAVNVFANNGKSVVPYAIEYAIDSKGSLLTGITDSQGKRVYQFGPKPQKQVLEPQVANLINRFMVSVTEEGGTARRAALKGFEVAGKTGTSQIYDPELGRYSNTRHIASFVGFVPASDPAVSVIVVIRNPRKSPYGGVVAGPVFREIAKKTLEIEGVARHQVVKNISKDSVQISIRE